MPQFLRVLVVLCWAVFTLRAEESGRQPSSKVVEPQTLTLQRSIQPADPQALLERALTATKPEDHPAVKHVLGTIESSDGKLVATVDLDTLHIHDREKDVRLSYSVTFKSSRDVQEKEIYDIAFRPGTRELVIVGKFGTVSYATRVRCEQGKIETIEEIESEVDYQVYDAIKGIYRRIFSTAAYSQDGKLLAIAVANGKRSGDHHHMATIVMAFRIDDTIDRCFHPDRRVFAISAQDEAILKLKFSPNSELLGGSSYGSATIWNVQREAKVAEFVAKAPQTGDGFRFSSDSPHKRSFQHYLKVNFQAQRFRLRNRDLLVRDFALGNNRVALLHNDELQAYELTHFVGRYDRLVTPFRQMPTFNWVRRIALSNDEKTVLTGNDKSLHLLK